MKRLFRKSKVTILNAKADEEYADDQDPDDRSEEFVRRSMLMQEYYNWKHRGNVMNPEESTKGFDLSDLEPKVEIGEGLDLKADEAYADRENLLTMKKLFNTYVDESIYNNGSRKFLSAIESFERIIKGEESSN